LHGSGHPRWQGPHPHLLYVSSDLYNEYTFFRSDHWHLSIFEIYPQSEIPVLTRIAHLDWMYSEVPDHLLPDTLIRHIRYHDRIVFRVVDYRTNYSTCFSVDVDVERYGFGFVKVFLFFCKTLKLASNYLLGRHLRRRQLLSSSVKKRY
jgi:hypothetical protein